jgi:O-methyltransferase
MDFLFQIKKMSWILKNYRKIRQTDQYLSNHYSGPIVYDTDGLTTSNNCDFINEPRFRSAYEAAAQTKPWPGFTLQWRVYIVCWFANQVKYLKGDFVECGVNTGAYARAIIDYIDFNNVGKKFYLLDTFEGLPEFLVTEEERNAGVLEYFGDHYKNVYEQVVRTFKPFNVEIIKGVVPDTLEKCDSENICYLSLDMNNAKPEIAAAEYFWDKLVSGAVMILDDYGFPAHIFQKKAFDEFAEKKGVQILSLPTGQGIIFKP